MFKLEEDTNFPEIVVSEYCPDNALFVVSHSNSGLPYLVLNKYDAVGITLSDLTQESGFISYISSDTNYIITEISDTSNTDASWFKKYKESNPDPECTHEFVLTGMQKSWCKHCDCDAILENGTYQKVLK